MLISFHNQTTIYQNLSLTCRRAFARFSFGKKTTLQPCAANSLYYNMGKTGVSSTTIAWLSVASIACVDLRVGNQGPVSNKRLHQRPDLVLFSCF